MPHVSARPHRRGNTLIVTVVLAGVLAVAAAGYVQRSQSVVEGIVAKRQYDANVSCAEAARQMLLSEFQAYGLAIADLTLDTYIGDRRLSSGHYDQFAVKSVNGGGSGSSGTQAVGGNDDLGVYGIANGPHGGGTASSASTCDAGPCSTGRAAGIGGTPYRFTVVCTDTTGRARQSEVEFLVRFGL